jgi:hypothetical protein
MRVKRKLEARTSGADRLTVAVKPPLMSRSTGRHSVTSFTPGATQVSRAPSAFLIRPLC